MSGLRITILSEDTAGGRGLLGEHGLALWVEIDDRRVLFDTGQGLVLRRNARTLRIRLEDATAVCLSHGHYDHTGGLAVALGRAPAATVYAHPAAVLSRYARGDGGVVREIGMPHRVRTRLRRVAGSETVSAAGADACDPADRPVGGDPAASLHANVVWTTGPTELGGGLFLTGPIPRASSIEEADSRFFKDAACREADDFADDQAAFVDRPSGTVVLLGCAHAGVVNTLLRVRELTGGRPIHAVVGGMHLLAASGDRVHGTIAEFRRLGVERIVPVHCTGPGPTARFLNDLPDRCCSCRAGSTMEFR